MLPALRRSVFTAQKETQMKPNGKTFVVRAVLLTLCAVAMLSAFAGAETVRGTFKLPVKAYWGKMVLAPGEYEFAVDTESLSRMVTIRSKDSGWSGMVLSESQSEASSAGGTILRLEGSESGMYVQRLSLNEVGIAMNFAAPKMSMSKLAKSTLPATASAAGMH
jgi:hypothetical protein